MKTYVILRRSGWRSPDELGEAAVRSKQVADDDMPDDIKWIRSYVLEEAAARSTAEGEKMADDVRWIRSYVTAEPDGTVGTVCIYQGTSPEAIREHASRAGLPVDEIIAVADTVLVRPDPAPVAA